MAKLPATLHSLCEKFNLRYFLANDAKRCAAPIAAICTMINKPTPFTLTIYSKIILRAPATTREAFRCPCGVAYQPLKIQCIASTRLNCFNHHNSAIIIIIDKTPHKLMHRRIFRSSYRCATPRTRPATTPRILIIFL